jgi:hypothetical protein
VRFHRSDATETSDSVQAIGLCRHLASTTVSVQSDDYRQVRALAGQSPMDGGGSESVREISMPSAPMLSVTVRPRRARPVAGAGA